MADKKKLHLRYADEEDRQVREVDTIEGALKQLSKEAKKGELEYPFVLEFSGPAGAEYSISVNKAEDVQEVSTLGFMF